MIMTEKEIVKSYQKAQNPKKQVDILSQLNDCSRKEIREILEEAGIVVEEAKRKKPPDNMEKIGNTSDFWKKLVKLCQAEGIMPGRVAVEIMETPHAAHHWRTCKNPRPETIAKLSKYFGVSESYFFDPFEGGQKNADAKS